MFFFFQAEDGIRDADVTGVQTCALPISRGAAPRPLEPPARRRSESGSSRARSARCLLRFSAEWTSIGAGVQRLAAVPAESFFRHIPGLEPLADVLELGGVDRKS